MRSSALLILLLLASACITKRERKDEVDIHGSDGPGSNYAYKK